MLYSEDWIMRQIEMLIAALIDIIFGDKASEKSASAEEAVIEQLLNENRICDAEDYIFERVKLRENRDNAEFFMTVLRFYKRLNDMSEEDLKSADFSHDEVKEGILDFFSDYCHDERVKDILGNVYLDEIIDAAAEAEENSGDFPGGDNTDCERDECAGL